MILFKKNFLINTIIAGLALRLIYLFNKTGDIFKINLGGDPCHHFNIAYNISKFKGPKTDFIFSYWHRHQELPALTDLYMPGFHFFSAFFLFFNESFLTARFISILIYLLNIILTYLICNELKNKNLGIISIFLISFNFFHIENSTVFMTVNFSSFIIQSFFYTLLLTFKRDNFYYLLGFITSYASITFGGWQILFLLSIINIIKFNKKKFFNLLFKFLLGFIIIFSIWSIYTKQYFGSIYYSNFNFYPFVENWGDMMNSTSKPNLSLIFQNLDLIQYIKNHIVWFFVQIKDLSLFTFPTFIFLLSFLTIPLIIYGSIKLNLFGKYLLFFIFFYFIAISLGSNAMGGKLWPRHYMPLLVPISILISSSLISLYQNKKLNFLSKYFVNYKNLVLIFAFIITTFGIFYKKSFWERNSEPFYELGKKIQKIVPSNSRIMYASTVQDLWCVTKREIIMDPTFNQTYKPERAKEEIEYYKVEYLLLDLSENIYKRNHNKLDKVLEFYDGINLDLIYKDKQNPFYLYKIVK